MLFRKVFCFTLVFMLLMVVVFTGVVAASPVMKGYYDDGDYSPPAPAVEIRPTIPAPNVDSSWIRFRGLDRHFVRLEVGQSVVVNLDVPEELAPYQVRWMSLDPNVATVVAFSPARITGTGVGETWVVAVVQTDTHTYYDAVLVEVVGPEAVAAGAAVTDVAADDIQATPPTSGGLGYVYSIIYGLFLAITGIIVSRRIMFES